MASNAHPPTAAGYPERGKRRETRGGFRLPGTVATPAPAGGIGVIGLRLDQRLDEPRLFWCSACRAAHQLNSSCVLDALRGAAGWRRRGRSYGAGE